MKNRKLFVGLFTLLMAFAFIAPSMVKATGNGTSERTTDVTIHKMELFEDPREFDPAMTLPKDHDGTVLTPTQLDEALGAGNYTPLPGVEFSYWMVNENFVIGNPVGPLVGTVTTGPLGTVTIPNLPNGYYYFEETFTPVNVVTQIASPFILGLPVMNAAGTEFITDLHIYPKNVTVRGAVVLTKMADLAPLPGAKFKLYEGVAPSGTEYVPEDGVAEEFTTNAVGEIIINNLPVGSYYFKETATVLSYLLDQTPIPFTITANGKVTVSGGLSTGKTGDVKEVKHYNFEEPKIDKSIGAPDTNELSADYNEVFDYILDLDLPADITEYTVFNVSDTINSKLDYKNSLLVEGKVDGGTWVTLTSPTHFTATEPALDGDGLLKIVFVPSALKVGEVSFKEIRITFKAAINETAIMGQNIPNKAIVDYNNGFVIGDEPSDEVLAYTGGRKFLKYSASEAALDGAKFIIVNNATMDKYLAENGGVYSWVTLNPADDVLNLPNAVVLESDANGLFEILGLKYGTYYLYEIVAPMSSAGYPYNLMEDPIAFEINKTSYFVEPELDIPVEQEPTGILNVLGPQIPQTGGIGTVLFTLIGGGLMGSALILNKKRSRR